MNDTTSIVKTLECFTCWLAESEEERERAKLVFNPVLLEDIFFTRMDSYGLLQHWKDFYQIPIDENEEILFKIKDILSQFKIPEKKWGRFIGSHLTVYDFLAELADLMAEWREYPYYGYPLSNQARKLRQKFSKLDTLINSIENHGVFSKKNFGVVAVFSIWLMSWASSAFVANSAMIMSMLTAISFFPIAGIISTIGAGIYTIYDNTSDKKIPFFQRMVNNLISLGSTGLKTTAYAALIASASSMTPLAPIFFVVASAVDAIHEMGKLIQIVIQIKHNGPINQSDSLEVKQKKTRDKCDYIKHRNEIIIQAVSAVAMIGIVAAMNFIPGVPVITVLAGVGIGLVFLTQQLMVFFNKKSMEKTLKKQFEVLESEHEDSKSLRPAVEEQLTMGPSKTSDMRLAPDLSSAPIPMVEKKASSKDLSKADDIAPESPSPKTKVSRVGMFAAKESSAQEPSPVKSAASKMKI